MASTAVSGDDCECGVAALPPVVESVLLKAHHEEDDSAPATTDGTIDTKIAQEPVEPAPWPIAKPTWWAFDVCYYKSPPPLPLEMAERQVPVEVWNDFWLKVKATNRPLLDLLVFVILASMLALIIYAAIAIHLAALWGLLVLLSVASHFTSKLEQRLKQLRYTEDGAFRDYGFSWTRHVKTIKRGDSTEYITVLIFHDDHAHSSAQRDDIWTIDLHNRDTIPALPEAMVDRMPMIVWNDFWIKIEALKRGSSGTTTSNSGGRCLEGAACLVCLLPIILFPALALVFGRKAAFVFFGWCVFLPCCGCSCDSNSKDYDQLCLEEEAKFRQYGFSVSVLTETNQSCCEDDKSSKKLLAFQEIPDSSDPRGRRFGPYS